MRQAIYNGMEEQINLHFADVTSSPDCHGRDSHAAWVAQEMGLPLVYGWSKPKDHGQPPIEGFQTRSKGVVIDDLISTGGSVLNAVRAINNTGAQVIGVVAVFTYSSRRLNRTSINGEVLCRYRLPP